MDIIGVVGGIVTTSGGIPQLYKMYTTKSAGDLSWGMLSMWATGLSMTLSYGISTHQFPVYVPTLFSLSMTIVMMVFKHKYSVEEFSPLSSVDTANGGFCAEVSEP